MASPEARVHPGSIAERLQKTTEELKALEQLIVCGDFSPSTLGDFRNAVDSIRQTARVVQMWVGLREQRRDPYTAISALSEDRVRRATQIAKNLTVDLQSPKVDLSTEGLGDLFPAVEALHERLIPLFRLSDRKS